MSWLKSDGAKIKIAFDKVLIGDVTGQVNSNVYEYQQITGTVTASHAYSGCPVTNAIDNLLTTSWVISGFAAGEWFEVQYSEAKVFSKWRMYLKSSGTYRPLSVIFQGSNDGSAWTNLSTATIPAPVGTEGWVELDTNNTTSYLYYRIYMNTCNSSSMEIFEIQFNNKPVGNESHFTITSKECDYAPGGSIVNVVRKALSVYAGDNSKEIVIEMQPKDRFENASELTVAYDGLGSLAGSTGNVEAFSQVFVPQGLAPKPDQNVTEHIEITSIAASGALIKINYINTAPQDQGRIEISSITVTGVLTNINDL